MFVVDLTTWWLIPLSKWVNPTYPIYNWGYNPLTKWDEPPSMVYGRYNELVNGNYLMVYEPTYNLTNEKYTIWLFNGLPWKTH